MWRVSSRLRLLPGFADRFLYSSQSLRPDLSSSSFASLLAYLAFRPFLRLWRAFSADFLPSSCLRPRTFAVRVARAVLEYNCCFFFVWEGEIFIT